MTPKAQRTATPKKRRSRAVVDWAPAFLAAFANIGIVAPAAAAAGVNRTTVFRRKNADPDFAEAWQHCIEEATDALEEEARRRAFAGSDVLLIFTLKGLRPERYRERYEVKHITLDAVEAEIERLRRENPELFTDDRAGVPAE